MKENIQTVLHEFIGTIPEQEINENIQVRRSIQEMKYLLKQLLGDSFTVYPEMIQSE